MIALIALIASTLLISVNGSPLLGGLGDLLGDLTSCKANCVGPVEPADWNACKYCQSACEDCFCDPDKPLNKITSPLCVTTCKSLFYKNPLVVGVAANLQLPAAPTTWKCAANEPYQENVCKFACTCSTDKDAPNRNATLADCQNNCKQSFAAFTYATFCPLDLGGGK